MLGRNSGWRIGDVDRLPDQHTPTETDARREVIEQPACCQVSLDVAPKHVHSRTRLFASSNRRKRRDLSRQAFEVDRRRAVDPVDDLARP